MARRLVCYLKYLKHWVDEQVLELCAILCHHARSIRNSSPTAMSRIALCRIHGHVRLRSSFIVIVHKCPHCDGDMVFDTYPVGPGAASYTLASFRSASLYPHRCNHRHGRDAGTSHMPACHHRNAISIFDTIHMLIFCCFSGFLFLGRVRPDDLSLSGLQRVLITFAKSVDHKK